jgi:adsorption protein B
LFAFHTALEAFLGSLAVLLLTSGIDDLIPFFTLIAGMALGKKKAATGADELPERRIAIFVPCWRESAVIGNMVRHNLSVIRYHNFDFFLGVYPNDPDTVHVAEQLASEFSNVHVAICPNPGPTSKADCLNTAYQRMELFEAEQDARFDTVVLHDAEDLIHPQAFRVINRERAHYEMVQIPVLPLPTGFSDVTHGVYMDEFSEYQFIDMRAREISGSFIPSNGVGTGFAREILERLARDHNEQPFDPASLTEDYEIGVRIHEMGYRQTFASLARSEQGLIATREYFPRNTHAAIRQRTRWITGIALQTWERHGWRGSWRTKYWFWRDRKGLLTNPISVLANLVFFSGVLDYSLAKLLHHPWHFTVQSSTVARLCATTLGLQWFRTGLRSLCVGRIFGWQTAAGVLLRVFHANLINSAATVCALRNYVQARRRKHTLSWNKTDHHYPQRDTLHAHRRELADVLIGQGYLSADQIADAQAQVEVGATLDLLLLANRLIDEQSLCKAMSLQSGLPAARLDTPKVSAHVLRSLPLQLRHQCGVVPFAVKSGKLLVATPSVPSTDIFDRVQEVSHLPIEFQLVTPSVFRQLCEHAHN